jgi:NAD-dependent dihydropyrimidine dehydrogenase PreA subunit
MAEIATTNQLTAKRDRGLIKIDEQECKGCGLCIEACPPHVIDMGEKLNRYGYRTAIYAGAGCTGCGVCFMVCPEPGAITVYVLDSSSAGQKPLANLKSAALGGAMECASN